MTNDWQTRIQAGDKVTWNDPDDGLCSRTGRIHSISYHEDEESAMITWENGDITEVMLSELS
jgi:hypothetical protein